MNAEPAPPVGVQIESETRTRTRGSCQKSVRLLELDGRVHALELTCACGEKTLVELEYPAAQTAAKELPV